jgi:hypothetical protein
LVETLFAPYAGNTKIFVASRYEASPLFAITGNPVPGLQRAKRKFIKNEKQLSLF